ncbi:MAG: terminase small subunit [Synergistales bacterium]|nr:terminase small subunit [Synergistales bacterium]
MFTTRQQRFIECYSGNATQAAIQAGYSEKTARSAGQRLLTNVDIQSAIRSREEQRRSELIADRVKRQIFWTAIMRDESESMTARLKASELLAKSEGDFLERIQAQVEQVEPPQLIVRFVQRNQETGALEYADDPEEPYDEDDIV